MSVNFKHGLARFGANVALVDLVNFHLSVNSNKNLQANSASVNFGKNSQVSSVNSAVFANSVLFSMMMHTLVC